MPVLLVAGVLIDRLIDAPWHRAQQTMSFTSGHALRTMALAASVLLVGAWRLPRWGVVLIGLLLLGIGATRVAQGIHYPTDVLGGWLAGLLVVVGLSVVIDLARIPASLPVGRERRPEGRPT